MSQRVLTVDGKAVTVNGQALTADNIVDAFITDHVEDTSVHVTETEKAAWNSKAAGGHTHDERYYTESEVDTKLAEKAASGHNHDDRYYTESEVDTKLGGKANSSHTHGAGDINSGTLPIARGGTGMSTNPSMLVNLASAVAASVFGNSPRPGVTGTLPAANGGTGVTSLDALKTALGVGEGVKIQTGSYTGTGTYGADNPCSLTFDFVPKLVFVSSTMPKVRDTSYYQAYFVSECGSTYSFSGNFSSNFAPSDSAHHALLLVTWANKGLSWYFVGDGSYASAQLNVSGRTYHYLAIG